MVYIRFGTTDASVTRQLNYFDDQGNVNYSYGVNTGAANGTITITARNTAILGGGVTNALTPAQYRYVIIPQAMASVMQAQKVNFKDFNQVSQYLNLAK